MCARYCWQPCNRWSVFASEWAITSTNFTRTVQLMLHRLTNKLLSIRIASCFHLFSSPKAGLLTVLSQHWPAYPMNLLKAQPGFCLWFVWMVYQHMPWDIFTTAVNKKEGSNTTLVRSDFQVHTIGALFLFIQSMTVIKQLIMHLTTLTLWPPVLCKNRDLVSH